MSVEEDVLTGLRDTVVTPVVTGPVTLFQLAGGPTDPDVQTALSLTRGPTDEFNRWGQAVLTLLTRGERSKPLSVHDNATAAVKALVAVAYATFGTTTVNTVIHQRSSIGSDSLKRPNRVDTFFIDLDFQS